MADNYSSVGRNHHADRCCPKQQYPMTFMTSVVKGKVVQYNVSAILAQGRPGNPHFLGDFSCRGKADRLLLVCTV